MNEIQGAWKLFSIGSMLMNFGVAIFAIGLLWLQGSSVSTGIEKTKLRTLLIITISTVVVGIILQIIALF